MNERTSFASGWSLVWNELLTKKLPMFLSRLKEMSGGCEKIVPVSGSFWSNLKFLRIMDLTEWLCKTLEQKFIFQIGTLNPIGINECFSFY